MKKSARQIAILALLPVLEQGRSLTETLETQLPALTDPRERALAQALAYGVMRGYWRFDWLLGQLLDKPLKKKDTDVRLALMLGFYQLLEMRIPDHAAVDETVKLAAAFRKPWARGLLNGVLRNFLRRREELLQAIEAEPVARTAHPAWLLERLQHDWPDRWDTITRANNQPPPLTLRVNSRRLDRNAALDRLAQAGIPAHPVPHAAQAVIVDQPVPVEALPGFTDGALSVQDAAAQLAAPLLDCQPGQRVLDACAAPGGKTAHLLELQPELAGLVAVDVSNERLLRIRETLERLDLSATLIAADAAEPDRWWDGMPFDRILLDAPCSATGVIRRHPDIKVLRRAGDIAPLVAGQARLLHALWPLLAPGGMLLYATCSTLIQENSRQMESFLDTTPDARELPIEAAWGHPQPVGRQILPGEDEMDGFYYARIRKG
jgi:16S rRNA (cytosine967-C5)-methyltransferase